jgi:hypothetical protein
VTTYSPSDLDPTWLRLVDDAAVFPPGDAPLHEATTAYTARREEWYAGFVGSFVLRDTDLPLVRGFAAPLSVVVTGGAGQVAGPVGLAKRLGLRIAGIEIALRDLDDLPGNARRVVAAVDEVRDDLGEDVPVHVELPQTDPNAGPTAGWLAAADEITAAELRLKFRTGGTEAHAFPSAPALAAWIDAALDRETPFKCTAGLHGALRHRDAATGFEHHGFLNVLLATRHAFDGASRDDVVGILEQQDKASLVTLAFDTELSGGRRWFTSFGSCSVTEPLDELISTGLLEDV